MSSDIRLINVFIFYLSSRVHSWILKYFSFNSLFSYCSLLFSYFNNTVSLSFPFEDDTFELRLIFLLPPPFILLLFLKDARLSLRNDFLFSRCYCIFLLAYYSFYLILLLSVACILNLLYLINCWLWLFWIVKFCLLLKLKLLDWA